MRVVGMSANTKKANPGAGRSSPSALDSNLDYRVWTQPLFAFDHSYW
jgi:hypothetical protein